MGVKELELYSFTFVYESIGIFHILSKQVDKLLRVAEEKAKPYSPDTGVDKFISTSV